MANPRTPRSLILKHPSSQKRNSRQASSEADVLEEGAISPVWNGWPPQTSLLMSLLVVLLIPLVTFFRVTTFDFVNWDDNIHVYANPYFADHQISDIGHFWLHSYEDLYIPLSYTLFGLLNTAAWRTTAAGQTASAHLDPHIFHAVSLVLHLLNTTLVFLLLRRLTRKDLPSLCGALLFAVHPLQVESVAWISELRGLLGATFCFGSLHLYLASVSEGDAQRWRTSRLASVLSIMLALCGLLSKPSTVVIALFIVALGHWGAKRSWKTVWFDALPYLASGAVLILVTSKVQAAPDGQIAALWLRPFVAGDALTFYLWKLIVPLGLSIDYGRTPTWALAHWWIYVEWVVPVSIAAFAFLFRRQLPYMAFSGWVVFASLLPVLGLTPFEFQHISTTGDRYAYLALFGLAVGVSAVLSTIKGTTSKFAYPALAMWIVVLAVVSFYQTAVWKNSLALSTQAVAVFPYSGYSQNNLGKAFEDKGQLGQAETCYKRAIELDPTHARYIDNLGLVYAEIGDPTDAETQFRREISIAPGDPQGYTNLGVSLVSEHQNPQAIDPLRTALELDPHEYMAAEWLATCYAQQNNYAKAIATAQYGLFYSPRDELLWRILGQALYVAGRTPEAIHTLQVATYLNPRDQTAQAMLSTLEQVNGARK